MAIALVTLSNGQEVAGEKETLHFASHVFFIDPHRIIPVSPGLHVLQDEKTINQHALQLHGHLSRVVELLAQSPAFRTRMGENQIVTIDPLTEAIAAYPSEAISIGTIQGTGEPLPSLLTLSLNTRQGRSTILPELVIDFSQQPTLVKTHPWEAVVIQLRPPRIGERSGPRFIQKDDLPPGLGMVLNETGNPARIFLALQYSPGSGFEISRGALAAVDLLCNNSV